MLRSRRSTPAALLVLLALVVPAAAAGRAPASAATRVPPAAVPAPPASPDTSVRPRNVILMIPDGCGPAALALGRFVADRPLSLDSILVGAVRTRSADSRVTDSAAGATAYATGVRTRNAMLALDPEGRPLGTLVEAAAARGMATGLVTTTRITHATPAAFASHVEDRGLEDSIAVQVLDHRVDVLLGGGSLFWLPDGGGGGREDGRDLLAEARRRGYTVVTSRAALLAVRDAPLLGLFAPDHLDFEMERDTTSQPSLAEMTAKTLVLLARRDAGFLLVVEGGRIDHAAHDDDPAAVAQEVIAYDAALRAALAFARRAGHTLVVSVADHETGGLGLGCGFAGGSPCSFRPESLRAVHVSIARMVAAIGAGDDPVAVVERGCGFRDLGDQEKAVLRSAVGTEDRLIEVLSAIESRRAGLGWSTDGHTASDVGLHAFGPGRERFAGLHDNTDVARQIATLLGLDLEAATARLRGPLGSSGAR